MRKYSSKPWTGPGGKDERLSSLPPTRGPVGSRSSGRLLRTLREQRAQVPLGTNKFPPSCLSPTPLEQAQTECSSIRRIARRSISAKKKHALVSGYPTALQSPCGCQLSPGRMASSLDVHCPMPLNDWCPAYRGTDLGFMSTRSISPDMPLRLVTSMAWLWVGGAGQPTLIETRTFSGALWALYVACPSSRRRRVRSRRSSMRG